MENLKFRPTDFKFLTTVISLNKNIKLNDYCQFFRFIYGKISLIDTFLF